MLAVDKYANWSVVQLVTDAGFIDWVKCPDPQSDRFWQEYLRRYPAQAETLDKARAIVGKMQFKAEKMSAEKAASSWDHIKNNLPGTAGRNKSPRIISIRKWAAAAAVIILAGATAMTLLTRKKSNTGIATHTVQQERVPAKNNKPVLTLADGTTVVLDSTNSGTISKQGGVTVINMNGRLAYNKEEVSAKEIIYNTITTPKGGQYELLLADGSRVWLNAESSLRFPTAFIGKERMVELTGEGYFEVNGSEHYPFLVKKGNTMITVLGTRFNVNAYEDEPAMKITLLGGKVKVERGASQAILGPGEQAVLTNREDKITVLPGADIDQAVAWKNGRFLFNSADIETVMRQVARWYDVDIVYESRITETITGSLPRPENVSQLLGILEAAGKVNFTINGKQIIVKRR